MWASFRSFELDLMIKRQESQILVVYGSSGAETNFGEMLWRFKLECEVANEMEAHDKIEGRF